jgi:hypothetical protein
VLSWLLDGNRGEQSYHYAYGRGFIIESPDQLLERYEKAREKQSNTTILDKLLGEYLLSKYRNNPTQLDKMRKKAMVEPYVHITLNDVNDIFGVVEAQKKYLFGDFWEQADTTRTVEELKKDFETYLVGKLDTSQEPPLSE